MAVFTLLNENKAPNTCEKFNYISNSSSVFPYDEENVKRKYAVVPTEKVGRFF